MQTSTTTSIHKVRRDALGGKRGDGHLHLGEKVRRPDPARIRVAGGDPSLTGCGGLAVFGTYLREQGIDRELARRFTRLKSGPLVVYPMAAQLRLLSTRPPSARIVSSGWRAGPPTRSSCGWPGV